MNTADIRNGLKAVLDGASLGLQFAWPNVEFTGSRPYGVVQITPATRRGGTLAGNEVDREDGILSVVVAVDEGSGEAAAAAYCDSVAALFTEGSRLSITGGQIEIIARPEIRAAFTDAKEFRVPVIVRYRALAS